MNPSGPGKAPPPAAMLNPSSEYATRFYENDPLTFLSSLLVTTLRFVRNEPPKVFLATYVQVRHICLAKKKGEEEPGDDVIEPTSTGSPNASGRNGAWS